MNFLPKSKNFFRPKVEPWESPPLLRHDHTHQSGTNLTHGSKFWYYIYFMNIFNMHGAINDTETGMFWEIIVALDHVHHKPVATPDNAWSRVKSWYEILFIHDHFQCNMRLYSIQAIKYQNCNVLGNYCSDYNQHSESPNT